MHKSIIDFYSFNVNVNPANVTPELRQALRIRNRYVSRGDALAMGAYFQSMVHWRFPDLARAPHIPVLAVFGDRDLLVGKKSCVLLERAIPGVRCETIRNARHSPMYEQAREFNGLLESFLAL